MAIISNPGSLVPFSSSLRWVRLMPAVDRGKAAGRGHGSGRPPGRGSSALSLPQLARRDMCRRAARRRVRDPRQVSSPDPLRPLRLHAANGLFMPRSSRRGRSWSAHVRSSASMRARPTQGLVVSGNSLIRRSTGHALQSVPAQSFKRSEIPRRVVCGPASGWSLPMSRKG